MGERDRLWIFTALVAAAFLALGIGQRIFGDPAPGLAGRVVAAHSFDDCLQSAAPPEAGWHVRLYQPGVQLRWPPGQYAGLTVFPTQLDALEVADRLDAGDTFGENTTDVWANVMMRRSASERETPREVKDVIYRCSEQAAVSADVGAEPSFAHCGDAAVGRATEIEARGMSCEAARALAGHFDIGGPACSSGVEGGYTCISINICCALFAEFMGDGDRAVVFKSGI